MAKTAKEHESLAKQFKTYHIDDPKFRQLMIDDAIGSMKKKIELYGTSQDPSEFQNPPEYSNPKEYKGFVMVIAKYKDHYKGIAKEMETGQIDLNTEWMKTKEEAGKNIVKYITMFRSQAKMQVLNELVDKRDRAKERSKLILN